LPFFLRWKSVKVKISITVYSEGLVLLSILGGVAGVSGFASDLLSVFGSLVAAGEEFVFL
jgi:hypothetical protein